MSEDVESEESSLAEIVKVEPNDGEDDSEDDEAADLDRLAAENVDKADREPISGYRAGADKYELANDGTAEERVDVVFLGEAYKAEDAVSIQIQAVEGYQSKLDRS